MIAMAETYRKSKVEHYLSMLVLRKQTLLKQLESEQFANKRDYLQGQLSAIELIVSEIQAEFGLSEPPLPGKEKVRA